MAAGLLIEPRTTGPLERRTGCRPRLIQRNGHADLAAVAAGVPTDAGIGEGQPERGAARRPDVGAGLNACVEIFGARTRRLVAELSNAFKAQLRFDHVSTLRQVTV